MLFQKHTQNNKEKGSRECYKMCQKKMLQDMFEKLLEYMSHRCQKTVRKNVRQNVKKISHDKKVNSNVRRKPGNNVTWNARKNIFPTLSQKLRTLDTIFST